MYITYYTRLTTQYYLFKNNLQSYSYINNLEIILFFIYRNIKDVLQLKC